MKFKLSAMQKSIIENIIVPAMLFILSFYDFNRGVDLTDAGFSLSGFLYFKEMPGISAIPTFWSNVLGYIFTRLPAGNTWIGCLFYCTFVIAASVLVAYFFCKKYLDYRIVAVTEIFAIFYCWNPNSVLYDYLSFLLFEIAMIVLLKGIEDGKNSRYIVAGILLGINTFVRLPNAAEIAAIVLVWFAGWYRKQKFAEIARQTGVCVLGYIGGLALSFGAIFLKYDWNDFVEAIEELMLESSSNVDYGMMYMLLKTLKVVWGYSKYVVGLLLLLVAGCVCMVLIKKFSRRGNGEGKTPKAVLWLLLTVITLVCYEVFSEQYGLYDSNWFDFSSIIGLSCIFLFWGIIVSVLNLFLVPSLDTKLLALLFLGMFYVTPLGSNNHIFLAIMNMFMLIPLVIYQSVKFEQSVVATLNEKNIDADILKIPYRAVLFGSMVVMMVQVTQFGANYVFHDENISITVEDENSIQGMRTNPEKAGIIRHMVQFCEENNLTGQETIFYCNGPGLAFTLRLEPILSSTWIDWYTTPVIQFQKEMNEVSEQEKTPLIILSPRFGVYYEQEWDKLSNMGVDRAYMAEDEKWQILLDFMTDNSYGKVYENSWYVIYKTQ